MLVFLMPIAALSSASFFFSLFKFIVMSIPVPYYQYFCSLFGCVVLVYQLPCGNYAHYYLGYGIHTIDELPF